MNGGENGDGNPVQDRSKRWRSGEEKSVNKSRWRERSGRNKNEQK